MSVLSQLPPWACAFQVKRCSIAERQDVFEFLLSSPAHSPVPYCLYPEEGILVSGTGDESFPEDRGNYSTTRLEAPSEVGANFTSLTHTHTEQRDAPFWS